MRPDYDWTYVAFDPGVTTGVSCWDATCRDRTGQPVYVDQFNRDDLTAFLFTALPGKNTKVFIYEGYTILPHKARAHIGSNVPTAEVIGEIKSAAKFLKVETLIIQPASILSTAQKMSGLKLPTTHSKSHWISAYNHGYYWLRGQNLIKSRLLREEK